jgi:alpha-N-acetylglucosaminidase
MQILGLISAALAVATTTTTVAAAAAPSTAGIEALVQRRLPQHTGDFEFSIVGWNENSSSLASLESTSNDTYTVSSGQDGKIKVEGNSLSALASG